MHYMKIKWREFLMVIGRGSRREHPQPTFCSTTKKKTRKKPGMRRIYFRSRPLPDRASSGDVTSDQNCTTLVRKKKRGEKPGMRRTYFR